MQFRAPWGKLLIAVSVLVNVVLIGILIAGLVLLSKRIPGSIALILLPPVILVGATPFAIRGYSLEGNELVVHRIGWSSHVSLLDLNQANFAPEAMKRSIRLFGNGGLFAFAGWFWNRKLGKYRAFATDLKRTVVLRFSDRTVVVSPSEPESFVRVVSERLPRSPGARRT
jgi:hypothetical protein